MRPIISVDRQWLHDAMCAQCGSMQGKVGNTYEAGKLNLIRYFDLFTTLVIIMSLADVTCIHVSTCSLIQVWNCALEVLKTHILSGKHASHIEPCSPFPPPGTFIHEPSMNHISLKKARPRC